MEHEVSRCALLLVRWLASLASTFFLTQRADATRHVLQAASKQKNDERSFTVTLQRVDQRESRVHHKAGQEAEDVLLLPTSD